MMTLWWRNASYDWKLKRLALKHGTRILSNKFVVNGEKYSMDDSDECNRLSKRFCIKSSHALLVFASILVIMNNVTYTIRVRELCSWTPTFVGNDLDSEDEDSVGKYDIQGDKNFVDNDVESLADIMDDIENVQTNVVDKVFEANVQEHAVKDPPDIVGLNELPNYSDSFGLDSLIKKKSGKVTNLISSKTHVFPLEFTPTTTSNQQSSESFHNISKDGVCFKQLGFSMLERLEETIKVGLAIRLNMEDCENTLASLVAEKGDFNVIK
nr:hypothetical protein [Tanacetum cinerariifolium]